MQSVSPSELGGGGGGEEEAEEEEEEEERSFFYHSILTKRNFGVQCPAPRTTHREVGVAAATASALSSTQVGLASLLARQRGDQSAPHESPREGKKEGRSHGVMVKSWCHGMVNLRQEQRERRVTMCDYFSAG